jgi:hypothetical protein
VLDYICHLAGQAHVHDLAGPERTVMVISLEAQTAVAQDIDLL